MRKEEILTAIFIAKKNITRNKGVLLFTILIISLGFISSIIVYGVLEDTSHDMQQNYIETSMGHATLEPYGDNDKINNTDSVVKKIKSLSNVLGVAKITKKSATFEAGDDSIRSEVYIVNPEKFSKVSVVDELVKKGNYLNKGQSGKVLMGCIHIKKCNDIKSFDRIDVKTGEEIETTFNYKTKANLSLQGIYDHRFIEAEIISYINERTAENVFQDYDSNKADKIIVRLPGRKYADPFVRELSKAGVKAEISTWEEETSRYSGIVDSFSIIGDLSFFIGVVISAISIYVVLYINILNKRSQIGVIKAIGIRSNVVSLSYVFLSLFLGIVGSIIGVLLTLGMIQYFMFYPIETGVGELVPAVTLEVFFLVGITITLASVASGYLVSKKIIKENIIEAIFNG